MNNPTADYTNQLLAQRADRAEQLLADRGWLTLAGLFWLQEGPNAVGAAPDNAVILVGDDIPAHTGMIEVYGEEVLLHVAPGVIMTHNDAPITTLLMQDDMSGQPDFVTLGTLTLLLIKRGARYGVRLFDTAHPARQTFPGLRWYPIVPALCLTADYKPHEPPRTLAITNVLGDTNPSVNPGVVHFTIAGEACCLEAEARGNKLFFNFRDLTNRDTTYPAGRFLYTDVPVNGKVTLDFNQATNPYCAYTPYATCPLPPAQNRLPVRIEAGEMRYAGVTR
ncbi:MAG: DUF1684 domain-containing protein [Caldilineaceae bacterium]